MKTIKHSELIALLQGTPGAMPVGIVATTDAKALKTNNPHGTIMKTVRIVGFVGADYETSVKNQLANKDANPKNFTADSLPWGKWLVPSKVIEHKGKFYLRTQTTEGMRRKQSARVLSYRTESGKVISHDEARKFLPPVKESQKQSFAGLSTANKQVWVRTYALDSIKAIRISGKTYLTIPD